jgi:hypothetical protein
LVLPAKNRFVKGKRHLDPTLLGRFEGRSADYRMYFLADSIVPLIDINNCWLVYQGWPPGLSVAAPAAERQGFVSKFPQAKATVDNRSLKAKVRIFPNKQFSADCTKFSYVFLRF